MNKFWYSLRMFLFMSLMTGILYPLLILGIAQLTMKQKADGDFVAVNGKVVGSHLIGQKFESEKYFWGRPSATNYNPLPSGGSNLGPISAVLKKIVADRQAIILKVHESREEVPSELLYASGSGLDPHISPSTAYYQVDRIVKARGWGAEENTKVSELIKKLIKKRPLGFLGKAYVNVLELNIAIDEIKQ